MHPIEETHKNRGFQNGEMHQIDTESAFGQFCPEALFFDASFMADCKGVDSDNTDKGEETETVKHFSARRAALAVEQNAQKIVDQITERKGDPDPLFQCLGNADVGQIIAQHKIADVAADQFHIEKIEKFVDYRMIGKSPSGAYENLKDEKQREEVVQFLPCG